MSKGKKVTLIVGITLIIFAIPFAVWGWRYATAPLAGSVEQQEEVQSGDFRIFSYNHFFDLCATVQTYEATYDEQYLILNTMQPTNENYYTQQQKVAANRAFIAEMKYQYNVDADKEGTGGKWRDHCLPEYIETTPHEFGRRTICDCN